MDEGEVGAWQDLNPIKATPLRFTLAVLGFVSEVTQAVANLSASMTMVVYQHLKYEAMNEEFEGIVKNYEQPGSIGSGSPESQD